MHQPSKVCSQCRTGKPLEEFTRDRRSADGRYMYCRLCRTEHDREYRQRNHAAILVREQAHREKHRLKIRAQALASAKRKGITATHLRRRYGLTKEAWHEMLIAQAGRCAICCEPLLNPYVDHCHKTLRVRALLCPACNRNVAAVESAHHEATVEYVNRFRDPRTENPYCPFK